MRLGLIHVSQETNSFNPVPATLRDFEAFGIQEGDGILRAMGGIGQVGGHVAACAAAGGAVETVPILRASALAGGRIGRKVFDHFMDRIAAGLRAAGPLDGLHLQLHGACSAEHLDDVEGAQAALCRDMLGPDVPIVLGLDHHANVTRRMVEHCDAAVAHRTQPHDPFDTGRLGAELLIRIAAGRVRPAMAWRKLPLLAHQEQFLTDRGPMKRWFDRARTLEAEGRVLAACPFPMQPWLDVAEGGWAVVVTTDNDPALADAAADELADLAWSLRDAFQAREATGIDAAVLDADRSERGVVVLSDTGDTVFGGAAGDSNLLLEAMLRLRIEGPALVPLVSAAAAARLAEAGEGATLTLPLGGDATGFFRPLPVTGRVRRVADGRIRLHDDRHGTIDMGRTAVFEAGPATVLVSELPGVAGNHPEIYRAFGIEPREYKMAVLKTASNFQYFAPIASRTIRVDTPGPGQSDILALPWRRIPRPIFPLDPLADWRDAAATIAGRA